MSKRGVTVAIVVVCCVLAGTVVAVVAVGGSSSGDGLREPGGAGAFLGRARDGVMFVQWTRNGDHLTGSLQEATTKSPEGSGLASDEKSFTGLLDGTSLTLTTEGGEPSTYVGRIRDHRFTLTVPGQGGSLTPIEFAAGDVTAYNRATQELLVGEYPSPCALHVVGHDSQLVIIGPAAAQQCARFVEDAGPAAEWTTAPQAGAEESRGVVCKVTDLAGDEAVVTDSGEQEYGREACNQLAGEGWG